MSKKNLTMRVASGLAVIFLASACASKPPPIKLANAKTWQDQNANLIFGGKYLIDKRKLTVSINGDSAMTGKFLPFTPTKNMNVVYQGYNVRANCYFGSVLSSSIPGVGALVADTIQGTKGKSADTCDIVVNEQPATTLYYELVEQL